MRAPALQTDWRTWFDASLFPLKIYVAAAVLCLLGWRTSLSGNDDWNDWAMAWAISDFYTVTNFVIAGYILSAVVLTVGGILQAKMCSWRAATWSISFGAAALIIGILMWHYAGGNGSFGNFYFDTLQ